MLYSSVCFQADLTPEKHSLVCYVSAIAEQTWRIWGLRHSFESHPVRSVPVGVIVFGEVATSWEMSQ